MWGSKIVQNMCEAVSRVIVSQAMNRITGMGYRIFVITIFGQCLLPAMVLVGRLLHS
jgi:hypothetical protein